MVLIQLCLSILSHSTLTLPARRHLPSIRRFPFKKSSTTHSRAASDQQAVLLIDVFRLFPPVPLPPTHEPRKALVGPGDAAFGVDLDEDVGCRVDVHLELSHLVQRAVQQGQQLLMQDVGSVVGRVLAALLHHGLVVVAVEKAVLPAFHLDSLQGRLVKHHRDDLLAPKCVLVYAAARRLCHLHLWMCTSDMYCGRTLGTRDT